MVTVYFDLTNQKKKGKPKGKALHELPLKREQK